MKERSICLFKVGGFVSRKVVNVGLMLCRRLENMLQLNKILIP